MPSANILVINDGSKLLRLLACMLESRGCRTLLIDRVGKAFEKLNSESFDLVIMRLTANRLGILPMLPMVKELWPDMQLILIGDELPVSEDIQQALSDFIVLPCRVPEIWQRLRNRLDSYQEGSLSPAPLNSGCNHGQVLSKLSLMTYEVRGSLLSISQRMKVLGKGQSSSHKDVFEALVGQIQRRISKLVTVTEEVISSFLILEELSEELPQKRQISPLLNR